MCLVRALFFFAFLAFTLPTSGCAKQSSPPAHGTISSRSVATSQEWEACEHGVPQDVCVKCHPELAEDFKRVGDWCPPHDVAESQCFECNPDLTFSPPKDPPEGSDVKLVADAERPLEELEPHLAPGKVTIFDFYAAWCHPCHAVNDHLYAKLARGETFAVRKVDVGSWESDLSDKWLGNVPELPYLIVFDARGRRVTDLSGCEPGRHRQGFVARRQKVSRLSHILVASGLVGALLAPTREAQACAACRNPSLPATNAGVDDVEAGSLRLGLTLTGATVRIVHEAGCSDLGSCDEVPVQPLHHHDQRVTPVEARILSQYAITDVWGAELQVPVRVVAAHVDYTTPDGAAYEPLDEGVHHRDEVLAGPGDPWLLGRAQTKVGQVGLLFRAGVTLPLGRTEENPFALGDEGKTHQHIQMGTGTFDPVLGIDIDRKWTKHYVRAYALGLAALYENRHGYLAPLRLQSGAFWGRFFGRFTAAEAGFEVLHESPERWNGAIEQDGSLGRTELLFSTAVTRTIGKTHLMGAARFPLLRDIRTGAEQALVYQSPLFLSLGLSYDF